MKKFLIVGLGNIGPKYTDTRHNIGFKILDTFAKEEQATFETEKLGDVCQLKVKGKAVFLLKPNTFMNLSGKAIKYWMEKENIQLENLLVITDDINLDFGTFRLKAKGSAGGHNGLKDTQDKLNTSTYPRFRFGVGNQFSKGRQVDYVLGIWTLDEQKELTFRINDACNAIRSFVIAGLAQTMNNFNGKPEK
ncbi:aminoacyl-tRNA hydrolase [Aquimarina agarivorans]|uniref:aminoacyl-tRNA hydrolase n=1 Tax=Aquimarina agarivorans TaxID=980584 RepID=UPI000248E68D|nr:aminoacyl-tRNA hydrolase [Aquimarina agarivorans]